LIWGKPVTVSGIVLQEPPPVPVNDGLLPTNRSENAQQRWLQCTKILLESLYEHVFKMLVQGGQDPMKTCTSQKCVATFS